MDCPSCGSQVSKKAVMCAVCGEALQPGLTSTMARPVPTSKMSARTILENVVPFGAPPPDRSPEIEPISAGAPVAVVDMDGPADADDEALWSGHARRCEVCAEELENGARFCSFCGTTVADARPGPAEDDDLDGIVTKVRPSGDARADEALTPTLLERAADETPAPVDDEPERREAPIAGKEPAAATLEPVARALEPVAPARPEPIATFGSRARRDEPSAREGDAPAGPTLVEAPALSLVETPVVETPVVETPIEQTPAASAKTATGSSDSSPTERIAPRTAARDAWPGPEAFANSAPDASRRLDPVPGDDFDAELDEDLVEDFVEDFDEDFDEDFVGDSAHGLAEESAGLDEGFDEGFDEEDRETVDRVDARRARGPVSRADTFSAPLRRDTVEGDAPYETTSVRNTEMLPIVPRSERPAAGFDVPTIALVVACASLVAAVGTHLFASNHLPGFSVAEADLKLQMRSVEWLLAGVLAALVGLLAKR